MGQHIHYEIFRRPGASGSWSLIEVRESRDEAIKFAHELITGDIIGVKVVKETYNEDTGDYLSLTIFEHGQKKVKSKPAQEDLPTSPCFKPDDLYSYHARKTIAVLLPDFLAHYKVTVIELGHRADLLERLEASRNVLQHAIQRVAVSQAAASDEQLPKIVRSLNELTDKAIHRVYRDSEKGRFQQISTGGFAPLANKLAASSEGLYLLNGAIALYLKDAADWDQKVHWLMALMDEAHGDGPGAKLLLSAIDSLISEVLTGSAGLRELIGAKDNHGAAVMSLVRLFLGKAPDATEGCEGLVSLAKQFAADGLPESRGAVAARIIAEFRSFKRLCPDSLEEEFTVLRQIANLVVMGVGKYLSHEDLVTAFVLRSNRLVTSEVLASYLAGVSAVEKLERLLFVEENVIGADNKRQLANYLVPVITAAGFEEYFQSAQTPLVARLQELEALRTRVCRSGFQENQRLEIADALDRVAAAVESRNRLFESIEKKPGTPAEKASTLLRLIASDTFTTPRLSSKAREMVIGYLSKPGFLKGYVAQTTQPGAELSRDAAVADLMRVLEKAGITPETGLKSITA